MKVGELFITLGIRRDGTSWGQASSWLGGLKGMALTAAGYFGVKGLGKAMIGFNSQMEAAKLQMASMMAIVKKTTLSKELEEASGAVDSLYARAVKVPGTFEDILNVEKQIALPVLKAGHSMKELEDIAVATVAAMQIKDVDAGTASRSIMRIYEGTALARDRVTQFIAQLGNMTVKQLRDLGKLANAGDKNAKKRLNALMVEFSTSKYIAEFQAAKNKSVSGQIEELGERTKRFMGKVGEALFKALGPTLTRVNEWLDKNPEKVQAFAEAIGGALAKAFEIVVGAVEWLIDHQDEVVTWLETIAVLIGGALLINTIKWMAQWGPLILLVNGAVRLFKFLSEHMSTVGAAISTAFAVGAVLLLTKKVKELFGLKPNSSWSNLFGGGDDAGFGGGGGRGKRRRGKKKGRFAGLGSQLPLIGTAIEADTLAREEFGGGFGVGAYEKMFGDEVSAAERVLAEVGVKHGTDLSSRARLAQMGAGQTGINDKFGSASFADKFIEGGRIQQLFKSDARYGQDSFSEQFAMLQLYTQSLREQLGDKSQEPKKVVTTYNNNTVTIEVGSAEEAGDAYNEVLMRNNRNAIDAAGGS